ncbi:MAG TPA: FixH family protein [Chloroflexia bacterium]|nr:FixH family protein [Chloroflexia bacterium]
MSRHRLPRLAALLLLLLALAACGGESVPTAAPGGTAGVQITMTTDPAPPRAGNVVLTFAITDAAGNPVTDADGGQVHITGDMPSMGHGGLEGDATHMGNGKWEARGRLSMGGEWRIRAVVNRGGALLASQEFRIQAR